MRVRWGQVQVQVLYWHMHTYGMSFVSLNSDEFLIFLWKPRVIMMPTLSSVVAPEGATMMTKLAPWWLSFQCIYFCAVYNTVLFWMVLWLYGPLAPVLGISLLFMGPNGLTFLNWGGVSADKTGLAGAGNYMGIFHSETENGWSPENDDLS